MVGRSDDAHLSEGVTEYVYLIGGPIISSGLDSLVTVANQKTSNVLFDYHYNDLNDPNQFYRRSDHWNFGRLGIPFSFFFTGVHEDYHRPSDEPEKIDYNKLSKISQVIFGSAIELANAEQRPVVDNQEFIEKTQAQPR
jgi:Zn-dependent M28 family amino/carboxypeptidase